MASRSARWSWTTTNTMRARKVTRAGVVAAMAGTVWCGAGAVLAQQPAPEPPINLTDPPRRPGQPGAPEQPASEPAPAAPVRAPEPPPVTVTSGGRQTAPVVATAADDGPSYLVSGFVLRYGQDTEGLPLLEAIARTEVVLGRTADGYVAPREGVPTVRMRIADAADRGVERYYASAIATVSRAIVGEFNRRGIIAVLVTPSEEDIYQPTDRTDPDWGKDLRPAGRTDLGMIIRVGLVKEVRTLGVGERVPPAERVNNPVHRRIVERSPIQPSEAGMGRRDLIRKELLDDYLLRLNRHPGRRVDASLAPAEEPGGVVLDYLVNESKPWTLYGQVSNTGTEQTNEWRERFGFVHTQLTDNDDILSLDYITAGFSEAHAVVGSYEAPLFGSDRYRWRVFGNWSEFTASDVGITGERFTGDEWSAGGELIANVFQRGELFVDAFAGARYNDVEITNEFVGITGEGQFAVPYVGLRAERLTDVMSTIAVARFEWAFSTGDEADIESLGRVDPDEQWVTFQWDLNHSMYLEPLIWPRSYADPATGGATTLAHEIGVSFRGQYAFDHRLIPTYEQTIGGLYTVRGYDESILAGDTVLVASAEYRFHIPRALGLEPDPSATPLFGAPFRWRPQQPFGRADWDLIAKGFFDVGRVENSDALPFERDETISGAGVGLEFLFRRNVAIRLDWGFALDDVPGVTDSGDNRLHFSATFLY